MSADNWGATPFRFEVVPGSSAFVIPFDTTRGWENIVQASIAAGGAGLAPGSCRGRFKRGMLSYSLLVTGQDVTVNEQVRTGNAGTSADWSTQGGAAGTATATAATPLVREFRWLAPDARLLITAGGTGPTTLILEGQAAFTSDFGS